MNVVSGVAGHPQKAAPFLCGDRGGGAGRAAARDRAAPLPAHRRHLGFIFGNGLMANFLGEYYGRASTGRRARPGCSCGPSGRRSSTGRSSTRSSSASRGRSRSTARRSSGPCFIGVGAATVREVGLGFKLNHRADDDVERFGVLAIHGRPARPHPRLLGGLPGARHLAQALVQRRRLDHQDRPQGRQHGLHDRRRPLPRRGAAHDLRGPAHRVRTPAAPLGAGRRARARALLPAGPTWREPAPTAR